MAASVSYHINGKYDGKALNQAQQAFKGLADSVKKIGASLVAVAGVKQIASELKKTADTFKENNREQTVFFRSLSNNSKIAQQNIRGLVKEFDAMNGYFTGAELVKSGSILSNMGLDEQQMRQTLQVARDMAASGIMPLEQAVKSLGQSYGGNITQLKKLYPELKNFTDEEIRQGKAVEYLGSKYAGFEAQMSQTFDGMDRKYSNALDGLKDSIGGVVASLKFEGMSKMIEPLNNLTEWFNKNQNEIINFFLHLPDVATLSMKTIYTGFTKFFSPEVLKSFGKLALDALKLELQAIWDTLVAFAGAISTPFVSAFQKIGDDMKRIFFSAFNSLYEKLPGFIRDWLDNKGVKKIQVDVPKTYGEYMTTNWDKVKQSFDKIGKDLDKNYEQLKDTASDFAKNFTGTKDEFIAGLQQILGQDLPEELKKAIEQASIDTGTTSGSVTVTGGSNSTSVIDNLLSSFGQLGSLMQNLMSSNWIGLLIQLISAGAENMKEKSPVFKEFLNIFSMIAHELNDSALVDFINSTLKPLMSVIKSLAKSIANIIAPILNQLAPVLTFIGNLLSGFAKVIQAVSIIIYNIATGIYNAVAWLWGGTKDFRSFDELNEDLSMDSELTTNAVVTGTAASYTAAKDVYITLNFNNSFVNGDAREIAIAMHNEIKNAQKLGYVS